MNFIKSGGMRKLGDNVLGLLVLATLLVANYGVFSRFILQTSVAWSDEVLRAINIWLIFICSALAFKSDKLISLELVEDKLKNRPRAKNVLKLIQGILSLVFGVFFVYQGFLVVLKQFQNHETSPVLFIPLYLINLGFLIGAIMLFFFAAKKLLLAAAAVKNRSAT